MQQGREATIILDQSVTPGPLIELESLAGKAVALLACRAELVSATIFRKPRETPAAMSRKGSVSWKDPKQSYWISLSDGQRNIRGLYELKPQAPVIDFEVVPRAASELVG